MTAVDALPLVFVTVGTDHHPFDRVIRWVDSWLETEGDGRVRCFMQNGTSAAPVHADSRLYLQYDEMQHYMSEAAAVVCHGGPGTIMSCRRLGKKPVVVPRRHDLGEHVDQHQVLFVARMAEHGQVEAASDEMAFRSILERTLERGSVVEDMIDDETAASVARFEALVDGLVADSRRKGRAREPR
jgi:UDP-N-acetylglucosamine transferase subunit ALG13